MYISFQPVYYIVYTSVNFYTEQKVHFTGPV